MKNILAAAACLFFLAGCSASKPASSSASWLTDETIASRDRELSARLPRGWFPAAEESLATGALLWLVRDDLGAGLAVAELRLDATAAQLVRDRGPAALAAASRSLRGMRASADDGACQEIGGISGCGYEVTEAGGGVRSRVVVFTRGKHFYECELVFLRPRAPGESLDGVYRLQEEFIAALTVPATSS